MKFNFEKSKAVLAFVRAMAEQADPDRAKDEPVRCYLAGPMRGKPRFNFDAFDEAAQDLFASGWAVTSPADIDRELGFDPDQHDESFFGDIANIIRRDVEAVLEADAVVALPGWEESMGARAEVALARWAGRLVLEHPSMKVCGVRGECGVRSAEGGTGQPTPQAHAAEPSNILEEALRLTHGSRQQDYGHPAEDFERTAAMWSAHKGVAFTAAEVAQFMVMVKLSRERHRPKRDNWVDMAGYAWCGSVCDPGSSQGKSAK